MKATYLEIAERSLDSAKLCDNAGINESCVFHAYHAFESAGGAFIDHIAQDYPMGHRAKINKFTAEARRIGSERQVGAVAIALNTYRNQMLYPQKNPDGTVTAPKDVVSKRDASKLRSRASGIVKLIKSNI